MAKCVQCDGRLLPSEQGALCSECYFAIICDPALADPPRDTPPAEGEMRWQPRPPPHQPQF